MKKKFLLLLLSCLLAFGCNSKKTEPKSDILGIKPDMSQENAHKRLREIGKLEKEERKQQEIWALNDDPRYSYLIVGFTKENPAVRYVTAKTREDGSRVSYSDVLDLEKARQIGSVNNYKYVQKFPAVENHSAYSIVASGKDPNYLTYLSLKVFDPSESEEDKKDEIENK